MNLGLKGDNERSSNKLVCSLHNTLLAEADHAGMREDMPLTGNPGLNLVQPRYLKSSTNFVRYAPGGGGTELRNEVAERLKVYKRRPLAAK